MTFFLLPATEGPGLQACLISLLSSRSVYYLDEEVLNNSNAKADAVASRVDLWRQRFEDERRNSFRFPSLSAVSVSSTRFITLGIAHSFVTSEIDGLIPLIRDFFSKPMFARFSWVQHGVLERLKVLLLRGSCRLVFPVSRYLMMNIWRTLREDDTKGGGLCTVAEAFNNAFSALRSLIHLGKAYRNAHESFTLKIQYRHANIDMKPQKDN